MEVGALLNDAYKEYEVMQILIVKFGLCMCVNTVVIVISVCLGLDLASELALAPSYCYALALSPGSRKNTLNTPQPWNQHRGCCHPLLCMKPSYM